MGEKLLLLFLGIVVTQPAQARLFDFDREKAAAYFNITGGASGVGVSTLKDEAQAGIQYSGDINFNYTGEFGFLTSFKYLNLKVGMEFFNPVSLGGSSAKSSAELYSADSKLFGYAFKGALDFNIHHKGVNRSYVTVGMGLVSMQLTNSYLMTAAGQAEFPGIVDHEYKAKSTGTMYSAGLGYEGHFADTTTLFFELGYRYLPLDEWKYKGSGTTFGGSYSSGDIVKKVDGKAREIDLSGAYVSFGFRFYF